MSCSGIDIFNPYSWIVFSGLLMGAAVTGLLKGKRVNWALFSFFLSGSVLLALLGLFLPGPQLFIDIQLLYFFIGSAALGIGVTWFWKSLGLAVFLLVSFLIIFIPIALRPWHCFTESVEVGRFRLLTQSGSSGTVEIQMKGADSTIYRKLEGDAAKVELELLTCEKYFFFLKERNLYRLKNGFLFPDDTYSGLPESFSRLILTCRSCIPGIELSTITSAPITPDPFITYVISLELQDGDPRIIIERLYI